VGFTYKSYNFVEKDPIIDEIRTIYEGSGANYDWIHENSGVSTSTLANWFNGQTKKPQAATINAVLRSLGFKLGIVPFAEPVRIVPVMALPVPRPPAPPKETSTRHVVQMAKYKGNRR
jgi:hypothetical protein